MRKQKPGSYAVTWDDLTLVWDEQMNHARCTITLSIRTPAGFPGDTYGELVLRSGFNQPASQEVDRVRVPLPPRRPEQWPGTLLLATMQMMERYAGNPWNWGPEARAQARGETA